MTSELQLKDHSYIAGGHLYCYIRGYAIILLDF